MHYVLTISFGKASTALMGVSSEPLDNCKMHQFAVWEKIFFSSFLRETKSGLIFEHFFGDFEDFAPRLDNVTDDPGYSQIQIIPVSEGMSFQRFVFSKKGPFDFLGFLRG